MKTSPLTCVASLLVLGLTSHAAPPAPADLKPEPTKQPAPGDKAVYRLWHDVQGRTVEATFRGIEGDNVFLQTKDGYVYRLPFNRLVPADLAVAKKLKPEGLGIPADPNVAKAAQKIDEIVAIGLKSAKQEPNALASDEQFVRRVYLDMVGRVPTREETMAFLADTSASKRAKVIDKLVSSDGFNSRMFDYFSDMLRMADDAQKAKFFTYEEWFKDQIRQNRPWDKIVYDMMTADGKLLDNGASGYLLRDKGMRLDNLSLTLSTFMGANVACAQCHDHPFADWTQRQFYEMASFFGETDTYKAKGGGGKGGYGNLRKELTPEELKRSKKLFLANALTITDGNSNEVKLPDDYKYKDGKPGDAILPKLVMWTAEDKKLPIYAMADAALKNGAGKEDLRETFAKWMTSPQNPRFAMTIANRLWKLMFGVAVKEPVTDLDTIEGSANPMLLTHLAEEMKRVNFDIRAFMRLLCNTQTYQREAITKEITAGEPYYFPGPILRRMTAEQAWDSCVTLAIGDKVDEFKLKRAEAYATVMKLSDQVTADEVKTKLASMGSVMSKKAGAGAGKNPRNARRRMMKTEEDEVDQTHPAVMDGLVLARASELQQPEKEQHFLRMFGQSDRQIADSESDEGSIPQVLMLMNGEAQSVLRNPRSLVLSTSMNMKTPEQQVESLYYSFFSRKPSASELTDATAALSSGMTVSDLTWVLFNSREFVFVQ